MMHAFLPSHLNPQRCRLCGAFKAGVAGVFADRAERILRRRQVRPVPECLEKGVSSGEQRNARYVLGTVIVGDWQPLLYEDPAGQGNAG